MKVRLFAALVAALVGLSGAAARAQESAVAPAPTGAAGTTRGPGGIRDLTPQERPQDLSVMFSVPWWYGIGVGAVVRYEIPIVKNGFIPAINDQFSLEPSLGLGWQRGYDNYCRTYVGVDCGDYGERGLITPALYGVWSFHITSKFRPYATIGMGVDIGIGSDNDWYRSRQSNFFFDSSVGLFYRFAQPVGLRAEIGSGGLKTGLSFYF